MASEKEEELKKLTRLWYQRLKNEGFEDIEDTTHPDSPLITWHNLRWRNLSVEKKESIESYYYSAKELLHSYAFQSEVHRLIWDLHCQGLSKRKIEEALKNSPQPYKREYIAIIIQKVASEIK